MASHKSAEKCIRKIARRTAVNKSRVSRIRTFVKKLEDLVSAKAEPNALKQALVSAEREISRGVTKGVLHRNTASRKVSRLAKRVNSLA